MVYDGPRAACANEIPEVVALTDTVFDPQKRRMGAWFPTLFSEDNSDCLRVIGADGRLVCHVGVQISELHIGPATLMVGCVGAVCTDAAHRGAGLAQHALRDAMRVCRQRGVDLLYISGDRGLYRRHGAVSCGQVTQYTLTPMQASAWHVPGVTVMPYAPEHLADWMRLHQAESVRFERPDCTWQRLFTPEPLRDWLREEARYYTVIAGGETKAYLMLTRRDGGGRIVEAAGDRNSIASGMAHLLQNGEWEHITWPVPAHDAVADALCQQAGADAVKHANEGTVTIINWSQLGMRLRPYFEERLGAELASSIRFEERDGKCVLHCGQAPLTIDSWGDLALLLFGPPPGEVANLEVAETLAHVLPLPRPRYGLSYI